MANFLIKKQGTNDYGTQLSGKGSMSLLVKPNSKNLSTKQLKSKLKIRHENIVSEVLLVQDGMSSTWAYYLYIGDKDNPDTGQSTAPEVIFPSNLKYDLGNCQLDRYYDICSYRCKLINGQIDLSTKEVLNLSYSVFGDLGDSMSGNPKPLQVWELEDVRDFPDVNYGNYKLWITTGDTTPADLTARVGTLVITQAESNSQLKFLVTQRGYQDQTPEVFNYISKGDKV